MSSDETLDLLQDATLKLAQSGSLKDRLVEAFASHLVQVDAGQLPEALRSEFSVMHQAMQREQPLPRESIVRASVRKMSVEEVSRHANFVVKLFAEMARGSSESADSASVATTGRRKMRPAHSALIQLVASDG